MDQNGWFRLEANRQQRNNRNFNRPKAKPAGEPVRPKVTALPPFSDETPPPAAPAPEGGSCPLCPPSCPTEDPPCPMPVPPEAQPPAQPEPPECPDGPPETPDCPAVPPETPDCPVIPPEEPKPVPPQPEPPENCEQGFFSQTVGARGPVLLQDGMLHEILAGFVHDRPNPRAVHTKGYGAFGSFRVYQSMSDCTALSFLQNANQTTPATARFSLAVSSRGTPDTSRNIRGFSVKFFAQDGVFDLLCNHLPVFLVRDAIRFPEAVRALMPSPVNGLPDLEQFWSFVAGAPETVHFLTWLYSDQGTVKSFRHIRGYSVNTYVWVNRNGRRRYVRYHWIPQAGQRVIDQEEAVRLAGENPDVAGEDLYRSIAGGNPVEFELQVQMMEPNMAGSLSYDPLDATKIWSETDFPPIPVGRLVLDRNPEDFQTQVENLAFSPANLLAGAELSSDRLLQGRANIYWNAQRLRLGPGFRRLAANGQQDWTPETLVTSGAGTEVSGRLVRTSTPLGDDFAQAGERFRGMEPGQQAHLISNLAAELRLVSSETRRTVLGYFKEADPELAQRLEDACR